jgi:PASTA domain
MARSSPGDSGQVELPNLAGMTVADARQNGHEAGLVVVSAHPDGPPLGGLTWPGTWIVTAQHPPPGVRLNRWDNVMIEFEELRGGEEAGDREPRIPLPDPGALAAELELPASRDGLTWIRGRTPEAVSQVGARRAFSRSRRPRTRSASGDHNGR